MRKVRWGILSTGRIARQFAADLRHVENSELVAVAARAPDSAQAFAAQHGIARAHGNYQALFADDQVDAIYVASPHTLHLMHSTAALQAGKAVLCEKPITTSPAECAALIETARDTGGHLMEAMWTFFLPAIREAQRWVAAGRIGRIKHIKSDFGYPLLPYDPDRREYDARLAGGSLLEMGVYPVAMAWLFLQRDPAAIQVLARKAPNGVDDDVVALFDYGDCTATLASSFRCKLQNWTYVIGDDGYIAIPDFWRASECHLYQLDTRVDSFIDGRRTLGFNYEATAFADDFLNQRRDSGVVPLSASLKFQEHMAWIKSKF